ncbi:hypothetical protein [Paenibacillus puerhi]|uniref:hypothetical protein n=1 Tax=Paenibacillus puerhi TaxID=2692622 RepID=UPI001359287B|nr:hypothetical protein [Paenibacillus puerhi]
MLKTRYAVSVANRTIIQLDQRPNTGPSASDAELVVKATPEEIAELGQLIQEQEHREEKTFARGPVPYKSADHDEATRRFNDHISRVYTEIYELGTPETRRHIEEMGILEKLRHPDYNLPGYGPNNAAEAINTDKKR